MGKWVWSARPNPRSDEGTFSHPIQDPLAESLILGPIGVFTQMPWRQHFDARPGTDWTVSVRLSIGRRVIFDAYASKC